MKKECLVARLNSPDVAQLYEIDLNQNLINNIRVLCTKFPESFKYFVPEELFPDIRNGEIIPVSADIFDVLSGNQFPIDPLKVLSEQIRKYRNFYNITFDEIQIRMHVEGYELPSPNMALVPLSKTVLAEEKTELMVSDCEDLTANDAELKSVLNGEDTVIEGHDADVQSETYETDKSENKEPMKDGDDSEKNQPISGNGLSGDGSSRGGHFRKILVIAGIVFAAIIAAVLFYTMDTSVERIEQALADADYHTAVTIYNEEILGHASKEDKVDSTIEEAIDTIVDSYLSNACDFEKANNDLEELSKIQKEEISDKASNALDVIELQKNSMIEYEKGLEYLKEQNFINAIRSFMAVSEKSDAYEDAQMKLELCVDELIDSVQDPQAEEECEESLTIIDEAIELLPNDADLAACRDELLTKKNMLLKNKALQNAEELMGKGEYKDALEVIDNMLKTLEDDPELIEKRNFMVDSIRTEYLGRSDAFIESNEYAKAFQEIVAALDILKDDESLTAKNEEYRKTFVEYIKTQVNLKITDKKYDNALQLLKSAQEIYACPDFDELYAKVEAEKETELETMKEYTAPNAEFVTYDGNISGKEDVDEYTLTAIRQGMYRFDVSDMMSGFKVNIAVYAPNGTDIVHSSYGLSINEGITATLEKDETYAVKVTHYQNDGHYILKIGQQKETINITNRDIVHDSIEYVDQKNRYDITTTYGGKYRFDLANVYSGFKANITVFDDHNYDIAHTSYGIENNQGLSVDLEAGRVYRVVVCQYRSTSTYDLMIGKQSATQTINSGESVAGEIAFTDQKNRYDYIADSSGEYIFSLSGMKSGVKCNISVFDDYDYDIGHSSYGLQSGESVTATLEKGKKYRIVVSQYKNYGEYSLLVSSKS